MFRRRQPLPIARMLWHVVWPRSGWARALRYGYQRVMRIRASHHAVALGLAVGVFVSITPFIGFHLVLALAVGIIVRGNLLSAAIGTLAGNPVTFPFVWTLTYRLGCWVLGIEPVFSPEPALIDASGAVRPQGGFWLIFVPMVAGSLPLGLGLAALSYFTSLWGIDAYRKKQERARQARLHL